MRKIGQILKMLFPSSEADLLKRAVRVAESQKMKILKSDPTGFLAEGPGSVIIAALRGGGLSLLIFREGKPCAAFASNEREIRNSIENALNKQRRKNDNSRYSGETPH